MGFPVKELDVDALVVQSGQLLQKIPEQKVKEVRFDLILRLFEIALTKLSFFVSLFIFLFSQIHTSVVSALVYEDPVHKAD